MHIKKVHLSSFGKYQNKELTLEKGVNLIYGPNEAGKSTFHKFIEGMFYGFFIDLTRRISNTRTIMISICLGKIVINTKAS